MAYEQFIKEVVFKNWENKVPKGSYSMLSQLQIMYEFPNGYGASVIHGLGSYGLELAVLYNGDITYNTHITDDVVGYIKDQSKLERLLKQVHDL